MKIRFKDRVIPLALLAASIFIYMTYILPTLLGTPTALTAVTSNSMQPTLERGDLAVIAGYNDFEGVSENDIVVYSLENWGFVVHRVVKINPEEGTVRTKGDANSQMDKWSVDYKDIRGRVVSKIPYIGYMVMAGKSFLSDLEGLGMPSPVLGGALAGIAVVLFLSGLESPPWREGVGRSRKDKCKREVTNFLSSDEDKKRVDIDISPEKSFSALREAVKSCGVSDQVGVVGCENEVYLVKKGGGNISNLLSLDSE